mgnify:CR=1 FL=1
MSIQDLPEGAQASPEPEGELTADEVYDLLSNQRRRYVMSYLLDVEEATLRDLSRLVAGWENDVDPDQVTSTQRKRVYTALHQTHLMRLDEYGVVTYDRSRGVVDPTERLALFEPYLRPDESDDREWHAYYGAVGLGSLLLGGAGVAGVPGIAAVDGALLCLLVGGTVLSIAAANRRATSSDRPRTLEGLQPDAAGD